MRNFRNILRAVISQTLVTNYDTPFDGDDNSIHKLARKKRSACGSVRS